MINTPLLLPMAQSNTLLLLLLWDSGPLTTSTTLAACSSVMPSGTPLSSLACLFVNTCTACHKKQAQHHTSRIRPYPQRAVVSITHQEPVHYSQSRSHGSTQALGPLTRCTRGVMVKLGGGTLSPRSRCLRSGRRASYAAYLRRRHRQVETHAMGENSRTCHALSHMASTPKA